MKTSKRKPVLGRGHCRRLHLGRPSSLVQVRFEAISRTANTPKGEYLAQSKDGDRMVYSS